MVVNGLVAVAGLIVISHFIAISWLMIVPGILVVIDWRICVPRLSIARLHLAWLVVARLAVASLNIIDSTLHCDQWSIHRDFSIRHFRISLKPVGRTAYTAVAEAVVTIS